MTYAQSNTVIDFTTSPKEAVFYFDDVIPFGIPLMRTDELDSRKVMDLTMNELLPRGETKKFKSSYVDTFLGLSAVAAAHSVKSSNTAKYAAEWKRHGLAFIDAFHLCRFPLFAEPLPFESRTTSGPCRGETPVISLVNLSLVDISKTSWEHILEIRRDKESRKKITRLRLFLFENYKGKDQDYVKDDILQRLDDYDEVAAKWGFETRAAVLSLILSSKSLIATISATFVSALFGEPLLVLASTLSGVSIEFGKVAVEVAKRKRKLEDYQKRHPFAYVFNARNPLEHKEVLEQPPELDK